MKNFIRYSKKRIVDTETRKPTTEKLIYLRHKKGEVASYIDAFTKQNLLPKITEKFEKIKYANRYSNNEKLQLGPAKPLNETKYYTCGECSNPSPNRFRCSSCWEKASNLVSGILDEDNYALGDYSSSNESYD